MSSFCSFLRKNFPYVVNQCRRAALDECKDQYTDAILLWIACWADLLIFVGAQDVDWRQFVSRWCSLLRGTSIFEHIAAFDDFDDTTLHTRSRDEYYQVVAGFPKGIPYSRYIREYADSCRTSSSISNDRDFVPLLRTCCLFLKRIRGPQLDETGLQSWIDINDYVQSSCTAPDPARARHQRIVFPDAQLTSGSVSDVKYTYGKQGLKARASCTLSPTDWKSVTKLGLDWPPAIHWHGRRKIGRPYAEILGVPKNFKKNRLISKEPSYQAWAQRRVALVLRDAVKRWTRGRCDPTDCSLNQWLICLEGYSTIDLTSASDTVHMNWINSIPVYELRRAIWATRTPVAKVGDEFFDINMAAGMGCGWTFPLECWVFSQIAEKNSGDDYAVFGDDIVVPDHAYHQTIEDLKSFGFIPNMGKSYGPEYPFKESCGLHVFHWGRLVDASPVYYPGRFTTTGVRRSPENFINLQRESSSHGWWSCRYAVSRLLAGSIPFSYNWDSNLPWSPNGNAPYDETWGTYPLSTAKSARYQVDDHSRYPFALLQDYLDPDQCWDPRIPWLRKTCTEMPAKWPNVP